MKVYVLIGYTSSGAATRFDIVKEIRATRKSESVQPMEKHMEKTCDWVDVQRIEVE